MTGTLRTGKMKLLTLKEAATYLGVSTNHAGSLCREGKLDCIWIDGHWQIKLKSLEVYDESRQRLADQRKILSNKNTVQALHQKYGSIVLAARAIGCPTSTFAQWFHKHGLQAKRGRTMSKRVFYAAVERAYDKCGMCPPSCPGRLADRDCLNADVPCIYEKDD